MRNWYNVKGQGSDHADVYILDEIGGWGITAGQFISDVKATGAKALTVHIDSPGGSIFAGLTIANFLADLPDVTTNVIGMAASMAGVIANAGKKRRMAENAYFMVHDPTGMFGGNATEMRDYADWLDRLGGTLAQTMAARTGQKIGTVEGWMKAETWFDAAQAKAANLVDEITPALALEARFNTERFISLPGPLAAALANPQSKPSKNNTLMNKFAALLGLTTATPPAGTGTAAGTATPEPTAREKFLAQALESFGIEPTAIATAQADNKPDFASSFVKDKLAAAEAKATAAEAKATAAEAKATAAEARGTKIDGALTAAGLAATAADIADGKKDLKALVEERIARASARAAAAAGTDPAGRDPDATAGTTDDLDGIRKKLETETDPAKVACLARAARKARVGIDRF